MPEYQNAHDLPVPFEQQQLQLEANQRQERDRLELRALEKRLVAAGYNLDELDKDNPYNRYSQEV